MTKARNWLLRHLARRLHIGEDILRHLSTFQRLGESFEIEAPQEMLPVGARTVVRALRSRAAPQIRPNWIWPYWLEQQLDPESPSFVPRGMIALTQNLTHRNWTAIGNLWSPWEAIVDPRGLVTPWFDGWSIDWWVHDGERWRYPSREEHAVQRLVDAAPVVETTLPVEGGDVAHRAYAQVHGVEVATVELENRTGRDLRVAFAIRPYNPEGLAVVEDVDLAGAAVYVDGALALSLPGPPRRAALSIFHDGDAADALARGADRDERTKVHDPAGLATATFVYDLPAGQKLHALSPMVPGDEQRGSRRGRAQAVDPTPIARNAHEIASTWKAPLQRGMRVELPDPRMQEAIDANRAYLLLLHDPGSITPGPFTYHRFWFRDAAYMAVALDRWGLHDEAEDVLLAFPDRQRADGFFYSQWREWDANGSAIWAIAEHHRLAGHRSPAFLPTLGKAVDRGARWIARKRRERQRDDEILHGLLPPGISAEHLGPFDVYYWDDFWSLRGLVDAAYVADQLGAAEPAADFRATAGAFREDILRSIELATRRLGRRAIPAGPRRGEDQGMIGSLVACEPLRLLDADDPLIEGTADLIRERFCYGPAFFHGIAHTGYGTYLTLQLAFVELENHDPRAWQRLRWLADAATSTWTWPEAIHPQLGTGCMGDGHHGWALADFLSFVRQVLVRERRDGRGLELLGVLPPEWRGEPLVVHDAPTRFGTISYRLRWEGEAAVLGWDTERASDAFELRAPSLDPEWVTTDPQGEVRLGG